MGRSGARNFDCDASAMFFEDAYVTEFLKKRDHNRAWARFYREWSRLPQPTQDDYGVEYLLGVIELWVWPRMREKLAAWARQRVTEAIEAHGPRLQRKHPGFLDAGALFALAQFAEQEPSEVTKEHALELIRWIRDAIPRLELFGGPKSRGGRAAVRSLRKLRQELL